MSEAVPLKVPVVPGAKVTRKLSADLQKSELGAVVQPAFLQVTTSRLPTA
jgi:hypothetical protein